MVDVVSDYANLVEALQQFVPGMGRKLDDEGPGLVALARQLIQEVTTLRRWSDQESIDMEQLVINVRALEEENERLKALQPDADCWQERADLQARLSAAEGTIAALRDREEGKNA